MNNKAYLVALTYYCTLILALIAAMGGYFLSNKLGIYIDKSLDANSIIYTLLILFTIVSIPLVLKFFSNNTKKISETEDEETKEAMIVRNGIIRNAIIGLGFILNIFFFYILREQSMIYMAGISAIALFFAKPRKDKNA